MSTAKKITPKKINTPKPKPKKKEKAISSSKKKTRKYTPKKQAGAKTLKSLKLETSKKGVEKVVGKRKTPKKDTGRPWFNGKDEEKVVAKLETAFKMGTTVKRACLYADISLDSYYRYLAEYPEFRSKVELWEENLMLAAESQLYKGVREGDWVRTKYVLDNRDPRYSPQQNLLIGEAGKSLSEERKKEIAKAGLSWSEDDDDSDDLDSDYELSYEQN